ncbi:hypothetical protein [Leptolinea tardivitalis]|uniref:Uncharacterized protein n=1 Tax=Leptolinea tardivitalis TaxID=229920 RepID=A0A0N8GLS6_9CHLR|nr:hypothetical protein [Leptolinea tardivitalis]KPL73322.1 hypothetical protein ADM99_03650 [Leptolinea tardivitalis]GAP21455.1 hypothetical protein LTAR_01666 [Leptolinea tardivitalis]
MSPAVLHIIIKIVIFWVLFLILHFSYDWVKRPIVAVFSGTNESFMQHAKIGFLAYSLASVAEYFLWSTQISNPVSFLYSRVITSMVLPWVMFIVYYIAPAFYGKPMPTIPLEIIYANIILLIIGVILSSFEPGLEMINYSTRGEITLWVLWIIGFTEMVIFTFRPPWADFFRSDFPEK